MASDFSTRERALVAGVELDRVGSASASDGWTRATSRALFSASYYCELVSRAEDGGLAFVTIPDSIDADDQFGGLSPGRLDALLTACRVAPTTTRIAILPAIDTTYSEPYHVANSIATLDHVSHGRAGWIATTSASKAAADLFGEPEVPSAATVGGRASECVAAARLLWDSWEDDAEIRDVATGRFIDRDRIHHVDFVGRWHAVKGPSTIPRPPQGQPLVAIEVGAATDIDQAVTDADLVFLRAPTIEALDRRASATVRAFEDSGRGRDAFRLVVDVDVDLARGGATAGSATELAAWIEACRRTLDIDGVRFRPSALPGDLDRLVEDVLPLISGRATSEAPMTFREWWGFERPQNRFAAMRAVTT